MKRILAVMAVVVLWGANAAGVDGASPADEALALLKAGNARFAGAQPLYPNASAARRLETAVDGQKPFAVILSCSDARVPVEAIFDRGIGDLFVVRVAGAVAADAGVLGSVEYAVTELGAPLVVILAHTECGAVSAALLGKPLEGAVRDIMTSIEPVVAGVRAAYPSLRGRELEVMVEKASALETKAHLIARSKEIARRSREGSVKLIAGVYDIRTGLVEFEAKQEPAAGRASSGEYDRIYDAAPSEDGVKTITYEQFMRVRNAGEKHILVDCLSGDDYKSGHIPDAISMPVRSITPEIAQSAIPAGSRVIVYCNGYDCHAAAKVARKLSGYGYKVLDFKGGLEEWRNRGGKLVK